MSRRVAFDVSFGLLEQALHLPPGVLITDAYVDVLAANGCATFVVTGPEFPETTDDEPVTKVDPTITHTDRYDWDWRLS